MTTLLYRSTRRQRGFTLVEVGIAAVLMAMLMGGALLFIADYLRGQYAQAQGQALFTFNTAVNAYEQKYTANLANNTAIAVPGYANVANIYAPTATELFHLGFLTNATPDSMYGVKINTTLTNGVPVGLSWLTTPFRNLQGSLDQALAGEAMQAAGGDAGMSTLSNALQVVGADGWTATNPVSGQPAAVVAMRSGAGSIAYVRLDGSTPMQGSLNLNNNSITNVAGLSASGNISAANVTASNNLAAGGSVTAGQNIQAGGSVSGSTLTATAYGNDVFFGSSALYSDGANTVIRSNGGALYVQDYSGNNKTVVAGQLVTPAGNGVQIGSSYYYGDGTNSAIRQNGTLYVQNQAGTGAANVDLNYLHVAGTASVGAGCSQNGLIAQDGTGSPLFCINGSWQRLSGKPNIIVRVGAKSNTMSTATCDTNETMTGGICYNTDSCGGNDSSAFGGYPSGNTLYCPKTSARQGCDTLTAYAYCAQ